MWKFQFRTPENKDTITMAMVQTIKGSKSPNKCENFTFFFYALSSCEDIDIVKNLLVGELQLIVIEN